MTSATQASASRASASRASASRASATPPAGGAPPLARLLAIAYRQLIIDLHDELARRGWTDVRPAYGFALLALRDGALSSGELAVAMGMTKQAGSKLVEALLDAGYVRRLESAADARTRPVELSERGRELQSTAESIYRELEDRWRGVIGEERLADLRDDLIRVVQNPDGELPPVRPLW